ncbi:MAG: hypothetical protein UR60_C0016G0004 [Candidatus Moranbacteria bacterium GW2011_GWF2_34_56]|nr:MAG: hypothetical protein UR51_C0009G0080 [Candidatus Moranbacteria bacterium GW2011_GWF1_34_10]KKP64730.1 MAG: hypothetical protein UR60_C0016G0004 [Candidatus Moranbacteria bacterium GW2011_GWF2_34_56]HBI17430.1 hypothetical protein [Candidatus Moranbacteria bacterium]
MKNFDKKKGSILAYTLIIITIVSIFLTASMKVVVSNMQFGINRESKEESLQIAEAGVYFYRWYLAHQIAGLTKKQIRQFWASGTPYGVGTPYEDDFKGVGSYSITVTPPVANSTIVIAEVTGWTYKNENLKRTVRVRFRQPAWSEYVVLCDSDIRFGQETDIIGLIHANGGVRFDGVAHNIVSSSMSTYNDPDHGGSTKEFGVHTHISPIDPYPPTAVPARTDIFVAGRNFPVPPKDFNSILADIADMKTESGCTNVGSYCSGNSNGVIVSTNGIYFNNANHGRHIILQANGTMRVSRVTSMSNNEVNNQSAYVTYTIPNDGVIFVEDDVWVEGTLSNKRVTIVAADLTGAAANKNIYLKRDLRYTNYDGSDIIGLVAQNDVEVTKDSENDLRIDGVLLATTGRVGREKYNNDKDSITIYGAIVTKQRYGFAWAYSDGTFSEGYVNRDIIFDNNLLYYPPPYFPTGTDYAIDSWEEI